MSAPRFTVERRRSGVSGAKRPQGILLPDAARTTLIAISADLRHAPRDCFVDRAELVQWLAKMARRVDTAAEMAVTQRHRAATNAATATGARKP